MKPALDAVVVGAGPNGLAAAITLAEAGLRVQVYEGTGSPGGGCRTEPLTLPGFAHDVCAAVHPLAVASPFFRRFGLEERGVRLLWPDVAYAHPMDDGSAGAAYASLDRTVAELGGEGRAWRRIFAPLVAHADAIVPAALGPLRALPRQPLSAARFLRPALGSAVSIGRRLDGATSRAMVAGLAAHTMRPLGVRPTGAVAALLGLLAHRSGWPVVEGGSGRLADAMVAGLREHGGTLVTGHWVSTLDELPPARVVLFDLAPRQVADIAGDRLPTGYRRALWAFRYGPGVCKVDWALDGPVPWTAQACRGAGTVHVGGGFAEVAFAEFEVSAGRHPAKPFVLVTQPGVVDGSRAPERQQTLWAYCHVPSGSDVDMSGRIEAQIERFAPGFRDRILARSVLTAADEQRRHPNYIGGDVNGGAATMRQTLFRPTVRWDNYRTPAPGIYLCSASTPPGGGVHGMCGYHAARTALRHTFGMVTGVG